MQNVLYSVKSRTHPGKVRANNQDALGTILDWKETLQLTDKDLLQRGHLFAVADGMGGHAAGEIASQLAIDTLFRTYYTEPWQDPHTNLIQAIHTANQAILHYAEAHPEMTGMGTTLVVALYGSWGWIFANVGDSRAYLFRDGRIRQVTEDHSWVAEQTRLGVLTPEQAAHHPLRNIITRSLGSEDTLDPDIFTQPARPGDVVLLCSDGLTNLVRENEITRLLKSYPLDEVAEKLLDLALERGAPDNVTLILIRLENGKPRRSRSIFPWLALLMATLALGSFLFWSYLRPAPTTEAPTPSSVVAAIATFTPRPSPPLAPETSPTPTTLPQTSPTPTPQAVLTAVPLAALDRSPLPTPPLDAHASPQASPTPIQAQPIQVRAIPAVHAPPYIFVIGPPRLQRQAQNLLITITHRDQTGRAITYQAQAPLHALPPSWASPSRLALGFREGATETQTPSPPAAWLLAPTLMQKSPPSLMLLWQDPRLDLNPQTPLLLYTVNGEGGGDSLGVDVPPGENGAPIAVLGAWHPDATMDDLVQFYVDQVFDYDAETDAYYPRRP